MAARSTIALPERYRVEHRIATGGMATVWAAHDEVLGRRVAVKVLSSLLGEDESYHARFAREARAAARISGCGHVVTIYDIGEHAGRTFIVMEHFGGGTLAGRLRGPAPVDRDTGVRWLREAATALDYAHEHGIVHRDVKPANLLLDDDDRLAVADFGIAHVADATRQLTRVGEVVGTAAYLSPEQALGQTASAASDHYSLAVVAFEVLCGERPYRAAHPTAQARQHVEAAVPRITERAPDLPSAVDDVLAWGMAKRPDERPATAAELVDHLDAALRDVPVHAAPTTRRSRRRRPLVPALLAVAALAAAGTAVALTAWDADGPVRQTARTTATTPRTTTPASARTAAPAPAVTAPAPQPPAPATRTPAQLNDDGFALIRQERYAEALPLLQRSVEGFRALRDTSELPYAYSLYNLAYALARTGHEAQAVPLLEERLRVSHDQRDVVRRELGRIQRK
jgi:eukaryotic-like serine/threonine-protein kinase